MVSDQFYILGTDHIGTYVGSTPSIINEYFNKFSEFVPRNNICGEIHFRIKWDEESDRKTWTDELPSWISLHPFKSDDRKFNMKFDTKEESDIGIHHFRLYA